MSAGLELPARPAIRVRACGPADVVSVEADLMGGRVGVHLRLVHQPITDGTVPDLELAQRDAVQTIRRIASWADRLTRFTTTSELSRLNADPASSVEVGPTLAAVLSRASEAGLLSGGLVDPTLLDARLAAEHHAAAWNTVATASAQADRRWALELHPRGGLVVRREGVRFDLGGVAKGWIADRAAAALEAYASVIVDADGDLAIALAHGEEWRIGVMDPRDPGGELAVLQLVGLDPSRRQRIGLATSGTSVHRWSRDGRPSHHLIDPRTGRPAVTDVVQATVLADSASAAEIAAKSIVILGSDEGAAMMERPGVRAVIVLTDRDHVLASPSALRWVA